MVAYRDGDSEAAVRHVGKSQENSPSKLARALGLAVLALAQHELEKPEEARTALADISDLLANSDGSHWDWQMADILRREAEALINGAIPAP